MTTYTVNYLLSLPAVSTTGWQTDWYNNYYAIDALFEKLIPANQWKGVWANSTIYVVGDKVVETATGMIFQCMVGNTSASSPTTFATDSAAHPTYWANWTIPARDRGAWVTATLYAAGDFVTDGAGRYGTYKVQATSGASYAADVGSGYISTIIDLSPWIAFPGTLSGQATNMLRVNAGATAYEFQTPNQVLNNILGSGTATASLRTSSTSGLRVSGAAGVERPIALETASAKRWMLVADTTAEGGANAGSDFALQSYTDAGSTLASPLTVKRSTGDIGLNIAPQVNTRLYLNESRATTHAEFTINNQDTTYGAYTKYITGGKTWETGAFGSATGLGSGIYGIYSITDSVMGLIGQKLTGSTAIVWRTNSDNGIIICPDTAGGVTYEPSLACVNSPTDNTSQWLFTSATGTGRNAAASALAINKNASTNRSINAAGTINASGADYAEYHFKAKDCGTVAAGQIIGIDHEDKITDKYDSAIRFAVKSTNPSIVGGDIWGTEEALGIIAPRAPGKKMEMSPTEATKHADDMQVFATAQAAFDAKMNTVRATVDRIAYEGRVPFNYIGDVGSWAVPKRNDDGSIGVEFVADKSVTFNQHRMSVGYISSLLSDTQVTVTVKRC